MGPDYEEVAKNAVRYIVDDTTPNVSLADKIEKLENIANLCDDLMAELVEMIDA